MSQTTKRKRPASDAARTVGEVKVRRGTKNLDRAVKAQQERDAFALPQQEFTNRARFVDLDGNSYAPPEADDAIYKRYRRTVRLAALAGDGLPDDKRPVRVDRSRGTWRGRALLYIRKRRSKKLVRVPRGTIQLLDTETMRLYTARVDRVFFRRESKSGHMIVTDLTDFGRISDPSLFNLRP